MSEENKKGDEKICPMTLMNPEGPFKCCGGACQWWVDTTPDAPTSIYECAIESLRYIGT